MPDRWKNMADDAEIGEILAFAKAYLKQYGVKGGDLDARALFCHAYDVSMTRLLVSLHDAIRVDERYRRFAALVKRRARGCPVAYLLGEKEFYSLTFKVNEHTLIPRPDTETLVDAVLSYLRSRFADGGKARVLEIGTGSGCVTVAVAKNFRNAEFVACDIDPAALAVAAENAETHETSGRVRFVESDLFSNIGEQFDVIMSNPPYIPTAEVGRLAAEVRKFEPVTALDGGKDGLNFYRDICAEAPYWLNERGAVFFEVGRGQAGSVRKLLSAAGVEAKKLVAFKDLRGVERVLRGGF